MTGTTEKPAIRSFVVLVDTNSCWTNEEDLTRVELAPVAFESKWRELAAGDDVTLMFPQVVIGELTYQKTRHLLKAYLDGRTNIAKVQAALGLSATAVPESTREQFADLVQHKLRAALYALPRALIVLTPTAEVGARIGDIIDAAVQRKPPFDTGKSEKGFRDAVILETVRSVQQAHPHTDVALITEDKRLILAAKAAFAGAGNFGLFPDLDAYGDFLKLARSRFTPERLHEISKKAEWTFNRAWQEHELDDELRIEYELRAGETAFETTQGGARASLTLSNLGRGIGLSASMLDCVGEPKFTFQETRLVSVVGTDEFHWATTVAVIAPYRVRPGVLTVLTTADLKKEPNKYRLMHVEIEWSTRVSDKDQLSDFKVLKKNVHADNFYDSEDMDETTIVPL